MKKMVTMASFKRTKESNYENGIAIGNNAGEIDVIIDSSCKAIHYSDLYSYVCRPSNGLIWFEL